MADKTLKSLPPEERIRKLKQLEKQKKEEIEEAQKQIRESQAELTQQRKWKDKVPIPEVAKDDLEGLSVEGRELLKVHRGVRGKKAEEEESPSPGRKKEVSLEDAIASEKVALPPEARGMEYGPQPGKPLDLDYTRQLSQRPMEQLYQEIAGLSRAAEEKGYLNREDARRVDYLTGAVEEKFRAADEGKYSFTEEVARAASVTQQLGAQLQNVYHRGGVEAREKNWYKGR